MSNGINKVILIGNVGEDPQIRPLNADDKRVATFSLATTKSWKNKEGEKESKTEWHRIAVFNQNLLVIVELFIKKGSKIYIEGELRTRKWKKDGDEKESYTTEIVLQAYSGTIVLLDKKKDEWPKDDMSIPFID